MKTLRKYFFHATWILFCLTTQNLWAIDRPIVTGYLKYLPSLRANSSLESFYFDQLLHNRFNIRWTLSDNVTFQGALRTRIFEGYNVRNIPFYQDFIRQDEGWVNASWVLFQENSFMMHTISDRFFFDFTYEKWQVRIGRQRINWGINTVSNPNDLFNTYSFFDFDYEERPGTDAIRVQYFASVLSRFEWAYSPGNSARESVAAFLYSFNQKNYDIQLITGYFRHRWAIGGGWAGSIKNTGFKGELTFFRDLEPQQSIPASNLVTSISADHLFKNSSYLIIEYLFNQKREGVETDLRFFTQPLRADNLSFTDHAVFANYTYPVSPVVKLGMAGFYFPSESGVFLSPNLNYNMKQNLDLLVISQLFMGKENSVLSQAGYLLATSLKWSF